VAMAGNGKFQIRNRSSVTGTGTGGSMESGAGNCGLCLGRHWALSPVLARRFITLSAQPQCGALSATVAQELAALLLTAPTSNIATKTAQSPKYWCSNPDEGWRLLVAMIYL
jgi:hypothetical protein